MPTMHYVCTGTCEGRSDEPGVCKAPFCTHHTESLVECDCDDGAHEAVKAAHEGSED